MQRDEVLALQSITFSNWAHRPPPMDCPHPPASSDLFDSQHQHEDSPLRADRFDLPHHLLQHHQSHLSHQFPSRVASSECGVEIPAAEVNPTSFRLLPRIATRMRQLPHEQRPSNEIPAYTTAQQLSSPLGTHETLAEFLPQHVISPRFEVKQMRPHVKVLCSFGGRIMARPVDGKLRYCGGETRIITLDRNFSYQELLRKMSVMYGTHIMLKYQLPGEDMDALISVSSEDDLQNLFDEYDKLESSNNSSWLRIFIFSDPSECEVVNCCVSPRAVEDYTEEIQCYVNAINGISVRMHEVHLEAAMNDVSTHHLHERRTANPAFPYSAKSYAKAGHSSPTSPPTTLRQTHHNNPTVVDMSPQTWSERKKSILTEASQDSFSDAFVRSHVLPRDMKLDDLKGNVPQQCDCYAGPSMVADTWHDVRHPFGKPAPQVHYLNHHGKYFIQPLENLQQCCHSEIQRQSHMQNQGFPEYLCLECNVQHKCSVDHGHGMSTPAQADVHKSRIESMKNCYPSSSSRATYSRCTYHPQHSPVHRGINVSFAEHKPNRILSHFDDQYIRNHEVLPFSSRLHNGIDHCVDGNRWQHNQDVEEQYQIANLRKNVIREDNSQFHLCDFSVKEHVLHYPQCAYSEFPLSLTDRHKCNCCCIDSNRKQIFQLEKNMFTSPNIESSQDHFGDHQQHNKYVEMCRTTFPTDSHPFQDSHRDGEVAKQKENYINHSTFAAELESNSKDLRMSTSSYGKPQNHLIPARETFLLDDLPNSRQKEYVFSPEYGFLSSTDAIVRPGPESLSQQHDWYHDPHASVGSTRILSEKNKNCEVVLKGTSLEFTEKSCISETDSFVEISHIGEESILKDVVECGSYSEIAHAVDILEDENRERAELLSNPSFSCKVLESHYRMSSTSHLNISAKDIDKNDFSGFSQSLSLSWKKQVPSGASSKAVQKQEEFSIILASPIYDQSPTSSMTTGSMLFDLNDIDNSKYANDDMCCIDKHTNHMISSVMESFSNESSGGKIQKGGEDSIGNHCDKIFEKGLKAVSDGSISFVHPDGHWITEAETNANIWKASISHAQVLSGLSYEGKDSVCFSIHEAKKSSSVVEAEAEAIARGLQIIKNEDLEELKELGSGTYGTVFHGKWKGTDVAIKRIKSSCFTGDPLVQERLISEFWSEAAMLSQLHHPNIVAFYGVVPDGPEGTLATVTEYMVNGSLKQVLVKKDRTIDRKKRLLIAMDAAFGMEYLHSKNVVHFDLKSENLLVNMRDAHRPVCKVGDFGLSKVKHHSLVSGGIRGTLPWMAPELLNEKSSMVTEKIDVYSFGIVMWELLTGEEPYANMQCGTIIGGIVNNSLRPPIPSWCDPNWKELMEQCWSADPADRPTFSAVASGLRAMAAAMKIK